jgi:outer membrane protein, multidrug efflux system
MIYTLKFSNKTKPAAVIALFLLLAGCAMGPNYKRPAYPVPPAYRAAPPPQQETAVSIGDRKWFDVFTDDKLQELIRIALAENQDVHIAAERSLAAEAQVLTTRSDMFPQLYAAGTYNRQGGAILTKSGFIGAAASWELDLWGKIRRLTEAARAEFLANEENRKAVYQSLIANVAAAYLQLRAFDRQLEVSRQSLTFRQQSLELVKTRLDGGVATRLDYDQSMTLVASAAADIATLEREVEQQENLINTFLGRNPGPVPRGQAIDAQTLPLAVPPGLPSALLERRPDIRQSEESLIAANARIGAAKAAFFPAITLTGAGGYQHYTLGNLVSVGNAAYAYGGSLASPIFDAGKTLGLYRAANAEQRAALLVYQKTIVLAFQDVSDALIGYHKAREYRAQKELLTTTLRDQSQLSGLRYSGGVTSYLEVLDTERQRLSAEQDLAGAQLEERLALVRLYKALGGGWQEVVPPLASSKNPPPGQQPPTPPTP